MASSTRINYGEVSQRVEMIKKTAKDIQDNLSEFAAAVNAVTSVNEGQANDALMDKFNQSKQKFDPLVNDIQVLGSKLQTILTQNEEAERRIETNAGELK